MARAKSPEKRSALFDAAVSVFAGEGLGAPTARIAQQAGVAVGTLFLYFATKDDLLNELYIALKREAYERVNQGFPDGADLRTRTQHVWTRYVAWGTKFPEKQRVTQQLGLSDRVTATARAQASVDRAQVDAVLNDLAAGLRPSGLGAEFVAGMMLSMQEAAMAFADRHPRRKKQSLEAGFEAFWRAVGLTGHSSK
jgi:AcrR family transcriptional regulator